MIAVRIDGLLRADGVNDGHAGAAGVAQADEAPGERGINSRNTLEEYTRGKTRGSYAAVALDLPGARGDSSQAALGAEREREGGRDPLQRAAKAAGAAAAP